MKKVEFWFDFASSYSYPAALRIEEVARAESVRHMFRANFVEDRDISDLSVLASVLERVGQPASLTAFVRSAEAKAKLRSATDHAGATGIFGAPSFVVGSELFWGNERLET